MHFDIITLFPGIFTSFLSESLLAKALDRKIITISLSTPRDFASDRHRTCDDRPYGGGPGMILTPEPLAKAIETASVGDPPPWRIYLSPSGSRLTQSKVKELKAKKRLLLICGRYEGLDQRIIDLLVDEEISIGDYVVNGGEIPAMVIIEAVARLVPGFMGQERSADEESHEAGLLEYPHYTRPQEFRGLKAPEVLLSGNHREVTAWRLKASLAKTLSLRPEIPTELTTELILASVNKLIKKS